MRQGEIGDSFTLTVPASYADHTLSSFVQKCWGPALYPVKVSRYPGSATSQYNDVQYSAGLLDVPL